jgi:hypothetical protein
MAASLTLPIIGLAPTSVSHELSACGERVIYQLDRLLDEVRRAEFFHKGGAARDLVREKRWLLLTSWLNLDRGKRRQLNALFALHRRILKAYLLNQSLSQLWIHLRRGHVALPTELDRPVALAAAETDGETSPHVAGSSPGHLALLPDQGADGSD